MESPDIIVSMVIWFSVSICHNKTHPQYAKNWKNSAINNCSITSKAKINVVSKEFQTMLTLALFGNGNQCSVPQIALLLVISEFRAL